MKAHCLTDLLNHTFPLDHCFKGTIFASSTHVLWELSTSELLALSTSQYFSQVMQYTLVLKSLNLHHFVRSD